MTMEVVSAPGSGSPDMRNFWLWQSNCTSPNHHIAGCFLLADIDSPRQDAQAHNWPHCLHYTFPLFQIEFMLHILEQLGQRVLLVALSSPTKH